jgi:hypothetical protein
MMVLNKKDVPGNLFGRIFSSGKIHFILSVGLVYVPRGGFFLSVSEMNLQQTGYLNRLNTGAS